VGGTEKISEILKDWRIRFYLAALLLLGVLPLIFIGLSFGMDFKGGSMIQLQLEKAVDEPTMSTLTSVLSERLNAFGLKDMSVRPFGDQHIVIQVSATDSGSLDSLKKLLSQQGKFEAVIDGNVVLYSEDLTEIVTNPQAGYGYIASTGEWRVPFVLSKDGSDRFAEQAAGKCTKVDGKVECQRIFMFIDRPDNAAILVPTETYKDESKMHIDPNSAGSYAVDVDEFQHNTLTTIIAADNVTEDVLSQLRSGNFSRVIVPEGTSYDLSALNITVSTVPKVREYWLWDATGLKSILFLTQGVTSGEPIREAVITGGASDVEQAQKELTEMVVILKSGRLPVEISIASTNTVSPTLGSNIFNDVLIMGVLALLCVGGVVFLKYRQPRTTGLMMLGNFSEVVIILGVAALIRQEIDLAGVAGIIAAVGTGVDQFIIIVDEVSKTGVTVAQDESTVSRIKKAFRIIMGSAATVAAAMLPLMTLGLGVLKGFAITTLIGVCVGVIIVRPAFAKAVELLHK
jgi:preprotein translocase subunit SecD